MAALKTKVSDASVTDFINAVPDEKKRADGFVLLQLFEKITHEKAKLWGSSIVGFGQYHYKSDRSVQEGDWPRVGFSPRKTQLSLYVLTGFKGTDELLAKLGKHKRAVGCLYINKLADVDLDVLEQIIKNAFMDMKKRYPSS